MLCMNPLHQHTPSSSPACQKLNVPQLRPRGASAGTEMRDNLRPSSYVWVDNSLGNSDVVGNSDVT